MKKIIIILAAVVFTASVFAQAPSKMSYQTVIRNTGGALVANHAVGIQISILQGSSSGTAVFVETQIDTTNANGLASLQIGAGTAVTGTIADIDWSAGPYFIKTETDPTGGTAYSIAGTSELLSVPYALSAGNTYWSGSSNNISNTNSGFVGIGTASPAAVLDVAGRNNWDLSAGEGDFRIGNSDYRLKMGVATGGGGAGDAGIMQYGQAGGYNVLSLGAQGFKVLYVNGGTQAIGIGTDAPVTTLDVRGKVTVKDGSQAAGTVLTSDANGTGTWSYPAVPTKYATYGSTISTTSNTYTYSTQLMSVTPATSGVLNLSLSCSYNVNPSYAHQMYYGLYINTTGTAPTTSTSFSSSSAAGFAAGTSAVSVGGDIPCALAYSFTVTAGTTYYIWVGTDGLGSNYNPLCTGSLRGIKLLATLGSSSGL